MDSHVEYFPENLGDYSNRQGERSHQDIKVMEQRYQGRWDENMMADYCWMLKKDLPQNKRKILLLRSFQSKRMRCNKIKELFFHRKSVVCRTIYKSHFI